MDSGRIAITQKTHSLQEVMLSVQSVLQKSYANRLFWVRCELSRISLHGQSGHCYLELIDKNATSIVAQMKGILWADKYFSVSEKFKAVTNSPLAGGMKILIQCAVSFHPLHGLSLIISDIEPSFTLGEMARMKNESISRLKSEGLFNLNKKLQLPLLPQRIAIISVATSRGFHDFISTLEQHHTKYAINYTLFEAILQGDKAVPTLSRAIGKIISHKDSFDAVAIIRGGAGDAGLSCYDEYSLSAVIARCELPVITGIGHATNETVVEMIAYKNCITPTAAAMFILEKFDIQQQAISDFFERLRLNINAFVNDEKSLITAGSERFCMLVKNQLYAQKFHLMSLISGLPSRLENYFSYSHLFIRQSAQAVLNVNQLLKNHKESLAHLSDKTHLLDPVNTLKRGYSITRYHGKALTDTRKLSKGMVVETELAEGKIVSIIEENK